MYSLVTAAARSFLFFFQAEDGIRDVAVTGVQTCALPIWLGGALLEGFAYDADGQLRTGSLMDYLLPTATDIPRMHVVHQHSPSPLNPLGVKGVGEGGAIAPPVVIANAVADALAPFKAEFNTTPVRPEQIVRAVSK